MNKAMIDKLPLFEEALKETPSILAQAFETISDAPNGIAKLRELILDLAVRGKLVPQDPNDEPASVLLVRIDQEKQRLVNEKKIRKPRKLLTPKIKKSIPLNWSQVYLQDICWVVTDGDHQPPPKADNGIPFLVIGNMSQGHISFENTRFTTTEYHKNLDWSRTPLRGDLLYTVVGSFGIPVIVETDHPFCVQRHVAILKPSPSVNRCYTR